MRVRRRQRAAQQFTQTDAVNRAAFSLCLSRLARSHTLIAVVEIGTFLPPANCKKHCNDLPLTSLPFWLKWPTLARDVVRNIRESPPLLGPGLVDREAPASQWASRNAAMACLDSLAVDISTKPKPHDCQVN